MTRTLFRAFTRFFWWWKLPGRKLPLFLLFRWIDVRYVLTGKTGLE